MRNHNQTKSAIFGKLLPTALLLLVFSVSFVSAALATPTTSTITPVGNHAALTATNGNKLVVAPDNTLHSVYAENGTIKYIKSSDGVTWTPPVVVSNVSNATSPVIAVASSGSSWALGIAFVDGIAISPYYTYKVAGSLSWSQPVAVANDIDVGPASEPSMIGFGSNMHLAWVRLGTSIHYAAFAATSAIWPTPILNASELVWWGPSSSVHLPSIAVSKSSATNSTPLVRIAYFYLGNWGGTPNSQVAIAQRPATQSAVWPSVPTEIQYYSAPWNSILDYVFLDSLSLAANPETGDFYAACSYSWTGYVPGNIQTVTKLLRENAWDTSDNWKATSVSTQRAQVDVTSMNGTASGTRMIRIAVSEFNNTGYGQTWFRTGEWISGNAPTWTQAPVPVSASARDPQAIFWTRACSSSTVIYLNEKWRDLYAIFTANSMGGTMIQRSGDEGRCFSVQPN